MKLRKDRIFIFLELIFGIGIGLLGVFFLHDKLHYSGLTDGLFYLILLYIISNLIGIGVPGFLHCKSHLKIKKFGFGIIYATIGIIAGTILSIVLESKINDFHNYRVISYMFLICLPTICGVIGFNKGIK
jgi:uncharacterized protein YacL